MPLLSKTKLQSNSNLFKVKNIIGTSLIAGALLISGCASVARGPGSQSAQSNPANAEADFVFKYLVAEIAGQRGDLATSSKVFYELAILSQDASLAERAAKVAAYGNVPGMTAPSIKLWSELDPTSTEAQQAMTEILIATDQLEAAKPHLAKLFDKEETRPGGFLYLNNILSRSKDKMGVLNLVQSLAAPYPDLAEAQFAIAQAAYAANQTKVGLQALEKAEALKPGWNLAALLKGQVLFNQAPQSGIDYYQSFLDQYPDTNEVRVNMAKIMVSQKQYDAAKKQFPIIIQYGKGSPEVTAVVGLISFQAGDFNAAEAYFQQSLAQEFKEPDQLYIYLAQVTEKQNREADAIAWFNKVQPGPRFLEAQIGLANLIARTQSVDKAIEKLDAVDDLTTEQQIIVIQTQASLLAKAKRDKDAFDLLDKAVKNLPNTPELVYDYALAAERVNKLDIMESELRKTIASKPDFAAAYNALGYSYADRNIKLDEAVSLIEKALSISPNDHYMLDSLGWAYYRKGKLDKAITYLEQAYRVNQDPEIAAHLGEVLWKKGKRDEAKKIWNDALSRNPNNEVLMTTASKFKS
ncbi:MAG: tetratricopeptide repeat protein [Methylotenera sp.]|uniref:tetratricopeptide repeat protein n=1 Tax=Methylotenera sp. TaxID=2051956 RepID=UPI0024880E17|nr:tetratricopeptide repeat protein [Methylotenera sp.]MDI1310484.1 tetratricopeptide repeat protein [Methylotenera sp.]